MAQIVPPTVQQTSDSYAVYADNFDLSLLPMDIDIPLSPDSQDQDPSQYSDYIEPLSPEYIPTTVFSQTEKSWNNKIDFNQRFNPTFQHQPQQQYYTPVPHHSPQEQFLSIFPPSPTPSIELNCKLNIKKEYYNSVGLYPPSPPDSNGAPSPVGYCSAEIKSEPYDIDSCEARIDIEQIIENSLDDLANAVAAGVGHSDCARSVSSVSSSPHRDCHEDLKKPISSVSDSIQTVTINASEPRRDHQLLREYLQDTTFQRKHNLKPLALESLFVGDWGDRGDIEPVISLALEHARKDVQQTCVALNMSPGEF